MSSKLKILLQFLVLILGVGVPLLEINAVYAKYYEEHAEGWHWYKDSIEDEKEQRVIKEAQPQDSIQELAAFKKSIEKALATAILHPTDENVANYIALQNRLGNQASLFSDVWQRVLLNNPDLDYSLIHPTNSLGKQVDLDLKRAKEDAAIAKLAKESGLFFFYSSSCAYCRKFAPILKEFAEIHKITIIPISTDGIFLPEFPNSKIDKGHSTKFNVTVFPSLFAVNPYTKKVYPISYGLSSHSELRKRILDISQNFMSGT